VIEWSSQHRFRQDFPGLSVRGPVERGFTSSPLHDKFTWRVPISGLIPLNLACDSAPYNLILKNHNFNVIGKQIRLSFNCRNSLVWPSAGKKPRPFSTFPTKGNTFHGAVALPDEENSKLWSAIFLALYDRRSIDKYKRFFCINLITFCDRTCIFSLP